MKSFRMYLAESVRTYAYKIKIAGDCPKNWVELFCMNLQKFDPVKIGQPKTTPVQKQLLDFDGVENQSVTMIDVEFKYPATEPMIKQLARMLNYDENLVRMVQKKYDDSVDSELEQVANAMKNSPILTDEQLADAGKEASKEYADQYLSKIQKEHEKNKMNMKFAGETSKPAVDDRKKEGNNKSPLTSVNRNPKPATGSMKG